jgi:hypothetical protein
MSSQEPLYDMITREMRESSLASPAISSALPVHPNPYFLVSNKQQDVAALHRHPPHQFSTSHWDLMMQAPPLPPTLLLPASPAIPTSPPHITCLPNPELLALLSGTSLSGPPFFFFFFFFKSEFIFRGAYNGVQRRSRRYNVLCLGV